MTAFKLMCKIVEPDLVLHYNTAYKYILMPLSNVKCFNSMDTIYDRVCNAKFESFKPNIIYH